MIGATISATIITVSAAHLVLVAVVVVVSVLVAGTTTAIRLLLTNRSSIKRFTLPIPLSMGRLFLQTLAATSSATNKLLSRKLLSHKLRPCRTRSRRAPSMCQTTLASRFSNLSTSSRDRQLQLCLNCTDFRRHLSGRSSNRLKVPPTPMVATTSSPGRLCNKAINNTGLITRVALATASPRASKPPTSITPHR
jgi:hypothetical protein